jgi:hypothetical protein
MATKVVHISDITGAQADQQSLGTLLVHEHPNYADLPVKLEVLPDEIAALQEKAVPVVQLEWVPPGAKHGERMTIRLEDFNTLGESEHMGGAILAAIVAKHRAAKGGQGGGGRRRSRARVNYATLEHAGAPHRGRITEAEKEIVRNNLDAVNRRLREAGMREINPNDPTMKERYGL